MEKELHVRRNRVIMSAMLVAAAGAAVALTVPAMADTNLPPGDAGGLDAASTGIDPDVVAAMQRDFSLNTTQVKTRITKERWAGRTESTLRSQTGSKFAGAWLKPDGSQLVVNVTDATAAAKVKAAGAEAKIVSTSEADLDRIKQGLDQHAKQAGQQIAGWYVDVTTASVVVVAKPGGQGAASSLISASGLAPESIRVVTSNETPRPLFDVRGADAYYIDNKARCSIGFSVVGGFVSAGHCGQVGSTTTGSNKAAQGTFKASSFPGNDYSFVQVNSNWTPTGTVNDFNGGMVTGSAESAVGASICRSGSTTGTHCGTVQAKNATVNYAEGTVTGLTRTNVCAEPGDSGGSWLSGSEAQGVTSGWSGNCTSGGTTFFQPVNEILQANNLTLVTSGGGGGTPPSASPTASPTSARPSASTPSRPASPSQPVPPSASAPSRPASPSQPVPPSSGAPSQPVPPSSGAPSQPVPPSSGAPSQPVPPSSAPCPWSAAIRRPVPAGPASTSPSAPGPGTVDAPPSRPRPTVTSPPPVRRRPSRAPGISCQVRASTSPA
jgi:streptogrisin C